MGITLFHYISKLKNLARCLLKPDHEVIVNLRTCRHGRWPLTCYQVVPAKGQLAWLTLEPNQSTEF